VDNFLSPEQVCDIVPGMTPNLLAALRHRGTGPRYIEASPRKRVYSETSLRAWLASRERSQTGSMRIPKAS